MASFFGNHCIFIFQFIILTTYYIHCRHYAYSLKTQRPSSNNNNNNNSFLASFVFGDSTVDPGNNNFINTLFRGNFPPYGIDFPGHAPTGRFCNGRLATDFIASYMGIKESVPAYLDPNLSFEDLITGVSFASSGTGYDPLTPARSNVIKMTKQLEYFDEYKRKVKSMVGERRLNEILKRSVFLISCGTNDLIFTYGFLETPIIQSFTAPTYLHFLVHQTKSFIQGLKERGAQKIVVVGLPPVGCLPGIITVHPQYKPRQCIESLSQLAKTYNRLLQNEMKAMQNSHPIATVVFAEIYAALLDQIKYPHKYGFKETDKGCCGTGLLEASYACNSNTSICSDRSKYVFWDSIHPTERSYEFLFESLIPLVDILLAQ